MSQLSREQVRKSLVQARPALITAIAGLELAAALWDGSCFLRMEHIAPLSWSNLLGGPALLSALMVIAAIYAGVGLLQMRRDAWAVWMIRHAWLGAIYVFSLPRLLVFSTYIPAYTGIFVWRIAIVAFSLVAGAYLYAVRDRFNH